MWLTYFLVFYKESHTVMADCCHGLQQFSTVVTWSQIGFGQSQIVTPVACSSKYSSDYPLCNRILSADTKHWTCSVLLKTRLTSPFMLFSTASTQLLSPSISLEAVRTASAPKLQVAMQAMPRTHGYAHSYSAYIYRMNGTSGITRPATPPGPGPAKS